MASYPKLFDGRQLTAEVKFILMLDEFDDDN